MNLPKINGKAALCTIRKTGSRVAHLAAKHSPALCVVGGIVLAGAAIYTAVKATREVEDDICDIEGRQQEWEEYEAEVADIKRQNAINEVTQKDPNYIPIPAEPNTPKPTFKEIAILLGKTYAVPALLFGGSVLLIGSGYFILNKRLHAAVAAFSAAVAEKEAILDRVEEEYGEEGLERITAPLKRVSEARGRKEPELQFLDAASEKKLTDNGVWVTKDCDDFYIDDTSGYNVRRLEEVEREIEKYFSRNVVMTRAKLLKDFLGYIPEVSEKDHVVGWNSDKNPWTGFTWHEEGYNIVDTVTGIKHSHMFVKFPSNVEYVY